MVNRTQPSNDIYKYEISSYFHLLNSNDLDKKMLRMYVWMDV